MIKLLSELISTPSLSKGEEAAADLLEKRMRERGLEVRRRLNNLWVESEPAGSKPTVLLNAHIDTVRPAGGYTRDPYAPSLEDGKLYGLGSNDDGGSLVALLEAYCILSSRPQPYRLVFSATAEEEICGPGGIEAIFEDIGPVDFGLIGEPTGMRMAIAERGLLVLDCKVHGRSGHAAREEGDNAIYKALKSIEWFRSYRFPLVSEYLGPVKMTVTGINAGTQHNIVPDLCTFMVDIRPNGLYTNEEIVSTVQASCGCEAVPRSLRNNSSSIPTGHPAVQRGLEMGLETFGSPTTSNQTRCPFTTLKMGPGESSRSHTADEYILVSEIEEAVDIYVKFLDNLQI